MDARELAIDGGDPAQAPQRHRTTAVAQPGDAIRVPAQCRGVATREHQDHRTPMLDQVVARIETAEAHAARHIGLAANRRTVDHAFRTTLLVLKDDDVISGLFRREEGETLVLADSTGKEVRVQKKQVAQRRESDTSLMPENFGELLTADVFNDLMAYLLSKSGATKPESKAQK